MNVYDGRMSNPYTVAATVVRVNAYQYKASFGDGQYAGSFAMLRDAQATIERSISPGAAPLPWKRQERDDGVELWYVLKDASGFIPVESARFLFSGVTPPPLARTAERFAVLVAVGTAATSASVASLKKQGHAVSRMSPLERVMLAAGRRPLAKKAVNVEVASSASTGVLATPDSVA